MTDWPSGSLEHQKRHFCVIAQGGQAMNQGLFHSLPPPGYDAKLSFFVEQKQFCVIVSGGWIGYTCSLLFHFFWLSLLFRCCCSFCLWRSLCVFVLRCGLCLSLCSRCVLFCFRLLLFISPCVVHFPFLFCRRTSCSGLLGAYVLVTCVFLS